MVDLTKQVTISLTKKGLTTVKAQVVLVLDVSGSMGGLYANGTVQAAAERVLALAGQIDDNQEVDVFVFDNGYTYVGSLNLNDREGWVDRNIVQQRLVGGGTSYAPVIQAVTTKYGNKQTKSGGILGFGGNVTTTPNALPTYVLFITDGENSDRHAATAAITEASKHGIFFQFVGIGNTRFEFLEQLDTMSGRFLDNANFFQLDGQVDDSQLYDSMLAEFPSWIPQARSKGLIN